ncbi:MAG: hypothetical protein HY355_07825 [Armatimonadetes bacterium]|nr:hypothetical protein [Armatimonadota bacterium]
MFLGHYGVALAAKKAAPAVSLGTLMLAAQLADLLWPIFLLVGVEHVRIHPGITAVSPLDFYNYPITHSLVGALGWSLLFGLIYGLTRHYPRGAWVLGGAVFYLRTTSASDAVGRYALWALLVLLAVLYAASLAGPAPPSAMAIAIGGLALWLFIPWAYWIDRHRVPAG